MKWSVHSGILLVALSLSWMASADFQSAVTNYEQKNFATAFVEFKRLSEFGDAPSQRNLAVMYARGEGAAINMMDAYAWSKLAMEVPSDVTKNIFEAIAADLTAKERAAGEQRFTELQALYGQEALARILLPTVSVREADCSIDVTEEAIPKRTVPPRYPTRALRKSIEGFACLNFYLSKDGRPMRIIASEFGAHGTGESERMNPRDRTFVDTSIEAIKKWVFVPAENDALREVPRKFCIDFKVGTITSSDTDNVKSLTDQVLADEENAIALLELSKHYASAAFRYKSHDYERFQSITSAAQQLRLRSAVLGNADAQYAVASDLYTGNQCEKDPSKGALWLTFAAQQGHVESQYLLGHRLMHGNGVERQTDKALQWYKLAADSGHKLAKLAYVKSALEMGVETAAQLEPMLPSPLNEENIAELEIAAMLAFKKGDVTRAISWQTKVVEIADELALETVVRKQWLAHFRHANGQASVEGGAD